MKIVGKNRSKDKGGILLKVDEIMNTNVITIDKDQKLSYALELMQKHNISRLVVTQNSKPIGIITLKDIANRLDPSKVTTIQITSLHVSSCMSSELYTISIDSSVKKAASIMIEKSISGLPVLNTRGELVGIITKTDLTKLCVDINNIYVKDAMSEHSLVVIHPTERLIKARLDILENNISGAPVVSENKVVGVLTEGMIAKAMQEFSLRIPDKYKGARIRNILVSDVMRRNPPTVSPEHTISHAAKVILDNNLNTIPVVDNEKLVGIITKTDLTKLIAKMD